MINWKVRVRNPLFWGECIAAVMGPLLAGLGMQWEDVTSWGALWGCLVRAAANPVVVTAVAVSLFNAVTDPTTKGIRDSCRALEYQSPGGEKEAGPR